MVMGKMVWMRGGKGASALQSRLRVRGVGLSVAGDMIMSNNSYGKGGRRIPK